MSIAKCDGKLTYWDFGEPVQFVQKNNRLAGLQFWDFGEPFLYGEVASGGDFFEFMWGVG